MHHGDIRHRRPAALDQTGGRAGLTGGLRHHFDERLGGVATCHRNDIRHPDLVECLHQQPGVLGGVVGPGDGDT
jgi:hypothetical protein